MITAARAWAQQDATALDRIGVKKTSGHGWCYKANFNGKPIDIFFPEEQSEDGDPNYGNEPILEDM